MFIDLSKVFNTLGHGKLIVKEKSPGLGDIAVESLPNIYFEELKELKKASCVALCKQFWDQCYF